MDSMTIAAGSAQATIGPSLFMTVAGCSTGTGRLAAIREGVLQPVGEVVGIELEHDMTEIRPKIERLLFNNRVSMVLFSEMGISYG